MSSLGKNKYAEYIRDFTALGNPFLLLLVSACVLSQLPAALQGRAWLFLVGAFLLNELLCSGIKFLWHKPRPSGQKFEGALEKIDAGSFPSIHAARIMLVYGSLTYVMWRAGMPYFAAIFGLVIAVVGYSRTFLLKHFWLDVSGGYFFGALWVGLLYWLFCVCC